LLGWAGAVLAAGQVLSQRHLPFSPVLWESRKTAAAAIPTHPDDAPLPCRTPRFYNRRPHTHSTSSTRPPSMDSESEHEHRDVNDVESESENEELEETKPKSAMKKPREAPVHIERPELP
jgi:hypothetical protein